MIGKTLLHYEILQKLGSGGMGEVYQARDTKLGREVALKLLPQDLARDAERMSRFRREAKVLASLQHPNIAGIFGLEEEDNQVFLAMELAEGTDLLNRIQQGPIPEDEVLDIARQLAAGLEEAHEQGIVHRDLKPANIKLGSDGKVKILDFGLARAFAGETAGEENLANSPTITGTLSQGGVILGTAAYMSPEQARGKQVDRRADIWSFGVVLFEMLTGKQMFEGETVSDTLAAVLRADLEWDRLPEDVSPGMQHLLERCLERDTLRRLRDIGEARVFLDAGAKDSSLLASSSSILAGSADVYVETGGRKSIPIWATITMAGAFAIAGTLVGWQVLNGAKPPPLFNTTLPTPTDGVFHLVAAWPGPVTISPDGTMVVYSMRDQGGEVHLYLRRLDRPDGSILSGTKGGGYPFWSPDSRYIGFFSNDESKLKKIAVSGGPPVTLCSADNMKGAAWNEEGVILFAPDANSEIYRVPASGGEPDTITTLNAEGGENSHRHPRFLPGGKQFLFLARMSGNQENQVYLASLDGGNPRRIATSQVAAEYSMGSLLTAREGILLAAPFDPSGGELGESVPLVENILIISQGAACAVYSSNPDGMLVYQVSMGVAERALEWVGAADAKLGLVGEPGDLFRPRISPDGTQAVVEVLDPDSDTTDLWLVNLETGLRSRFTFGPDNEETAVWTPDGEEILYIADVDTLETIMRRPVEGTGGATMLHESDRDIVLTGVSPDGKTVLISRDDPETDWNIYSMDLATGDVEVVIETDDTEYGGMFSPDGRWIAYGSGAASTWHVFVRPTTGGDRRWQVNRDNGTYPFWGPNGNTLYYIEVTGDIRRVPVDGSASTFRAGAPEPFVRVASPGGGGIYVSLHPDGERILHVAGAVSEDESGYLRLVTDWKRGLAN
jgi:serine/threonine protein kinase